MHRILHLPSSAKHRGRIFGLVVLRSQSRTYLDRHLGRTGIVDAIVGLGLSNTPIRLLFTETAVFLGLLQLFMPLMIIS